MYRYVTGASALVILVSLAGIPATVSADDHKKSCNVLLDGDGEPVRANDNDVTHSNSSDCPGTEVSAVDNTERAVETVAVARAPEAEPLSVYFDIGKDSLDNSGEAEVKAYIGELLETGPRSLQVVGFTDTTGPADVNKRISEARAKSVVDALVEGGVPADIIERRASGEGDLAVDTPDDTREASNRRVTVTPSY